MEEARLKEILKSLSSTELKDVEKIDLCNEILEGYKTVNVSEYEQKLKEAEEKYNTLEQRYKDTFFKKLEAEPEKQTTEEAKEEQATLDDVLKLF